MKIVEFINYSALVSEASWTGDHMIKISAWILKFAFLLDIERKS